MEKTRVIHTKCNPIRRKLVNHAAKLIPKPQVSFRTSKVRNPHHRNIANSIVFKHLPKRGSSLISIIAIAINVSSSISSHSDIGTPCGMKPLFI